jgi:hypothetical protein
VLMVGTPLCSRLAKDIFGTAGARDGQIEIRRQRGTLQKDTIILPTLGVKPDRS